MYPIFNYIIRNLGCTSHVLRLE